MPQSVSKSKPAPLLTELQRASAARDARLAGEVHLPAHADESRWDDPDDQVNTRSPKQVRGYRRGDALGNLHRRGTDVTRDHMEAAHLFRVDWDIAALGLSGADPLAERVSGSAAGPALGPPAAAVVRAEKQREVSRVIRFVGPAAVPILLAVVVENHDVATWCRTLDAAAPPNTPKRDAKKELGKLLALLARLAEYYGIDEARDRAKQARAELERR